MRVCLTTSGKKFILDRCQFVTNFEEKNFYKTFAGNIVRDNGDDTWTEIPAAAAAAHILLMPYPIAAELFPGNANLIETI